MNSPAISFAPESEVTRYDIAVLLFIIAIVALLIAGGAAFYCMIKGGNLEWTQYFMTFVKIACRFR